MKNIAIILAGGIGSRLNAGIPKQFLKVAGKTVIEHSISVFQKHPLIDEIAVVANESYHRKIEEYVIKNNFTKIKKILTSGIERHYSSLSAIILYNKLNAFFNFLETCIGLMFNFSEISFWFKSS